MRRYLTIFMCAFLMLYPIYAQAELSVAVVDVQMLLTQSEAAKSIQEQSEKYRNEFLEKLSKQEQELRASEKKLVEEGKSLPKEEFLERKKEFETKFIETQKRAKQRKKQIDQAYAKAMNDLMDNIYSVVQTIADEKKYNLVLSKQNVIIGEKSLNISEESLKILNEKMSDVKLEIPEE